MLGNRGVTPLSAAALVVVLLAAIMAPRAAEGQQDGSLASFRIAVLPDTQKYSMTDGGGAIARAQMDWVLDNAAGTNTVFVTHVGDVVENPNSQTEWDRMEPGFDRLEARGIAYGIAPGNHDLAMGGGPVVYDQRFSASHYNALPWHGGHHFNEGTRSTYQLLSVEGHDLLFVHIRHLRSTYGDPDAVIDWMGDVLSDHPDRLAFVTTHEFTGIDGSIHNAALLAELEEHCNVAAVFSGHRPDGSHRGTYLDECDRPVHHVLTNYQTYPNGGDGWLRTIDIDPMTLQATSIVYSPTLDQRQTEAGANFTVQLSKLTPKLGDPSCDRDVGLLDALTISQYIVGLRSNRSSCPLADPGAEINLATADVNGDGQVTLLDALTISRCHVGLPDAVFCP